MSKFIELHDQEGTARLVNLNHVEEIHKTDEDDYARAYVYFAFTTPGEYAQDSFRTVESYDEVKRLIEEATK